MKHMLYAPFHKQRPLRGSSGPFIVYHSAVDDLRQLFMNFGLELIHGTSTISPSVSPGSKSRPVALVRRWKPCSLSKKNLQTSTRPKANKDTEPREIEFRFSFAQGLLRHIYEWFLMLASKDDARKLQIVQSTTLRRLEHLAGRLRPIAESQTRTMNNEHGYRGQCFRLSSAA